MLRNIIIWPMVIPDEKYQNSQTGGGASVPRRGGFSPPVPALAPLCPPCSAVPGAELMTVKRVNPHL